MYYDLMHKDDKVGIIDIDDDFKLPRSFTPINPELVPLRAEKSKDDFRSGFEERAIPKSRLDLDSFLFERNIRNTSEYLVDNLALSLSDCYWIRPSESHISWGDVNLYDNDFLIIKNHQGINSTFSPDASTGGDLPKWWTVIDDRRFLVKSNSGGNYQQSFNEVFASCLHKKQTEARYAEYTFEHLSDGRYGCKVEAFTNQRLEFISAWDIVHSNDYKEKEYTRTGFVDCLESKGMDRNEVNRFMDYMALTDFLIGNVDRHLNNFGVLRNTESLEFVTMAPLFDFGNSMGFGQAEIDNGILLFGKIKGFNSTYKKSISNVLDFSLVEVEQLPERETVESFYEESRMSEKDIKRLGIFFEERKSIVRQLIEGKSFFEATQRFKR